MSCGDRDREDEPPGGSREKGKARLHRYGTGVEKRFAGPVMRFSPDPALYILDLVPIDPPLADVLTFALADRPDRRPERPQGRNIAGST